MWVELVFVILQAMLRKSTSCTRRNALFKVNSKILSLVNASAVGAVVYMMVAAGASYRGLFARCQCALLCYNLKGDRVINHGAAEPQRCKPVLQHLLAGVYWSSILFTVSGRNYCSS